MFKDEKLKRIHEESKKVVDEHLKKLDSISNDIKTLNKFLKSSAVSAGISLEIEEAGHEKNFSRILLWDGDNIFWRSDEWSSCKRLIETPAKIRVAVSDYLSVFLEMCMSSIKRN